MRVCASTRAKIFTGDAWAGPTENAVGAGQNSRRHRGGEAVEQFGAGWHDA
jgi:hypothetical protein